MRQSCFSTVMNLPAGTSSCLPSDQSEQPAQVSSARRTSRGSPAWSTSSRWVERFGEEVSRTPGIAWQQLCQRPPRWSVDEAPGLILILAPRGQKTESVLGEGGYRWHVSLYFGVCVKVCGDIFMHSAIYIQYAHCTAMAWREVGVGVLNML